MAAILSWIMGLMLAILVIPVVIVDRNESRAVETVAGEPAVPAAAEATYIESSTGIEIPIYLSAQKRIENVSLERYVRGVVAAEMPIEFELEALKAQAIAARTYIVKRLYDQDTSNVPVKGAWVTDSVVHQAYLTDDKLERKWDRTVREDNMRKLNDAVEQTRGQIATFDGEPILAAYFSTSNGYTENSEDYWPMKLPYLRSVRSPWEQNLSPKFKSSVKLSASQLYSKLGLDKSAAAIAQASNKRAKVSVKVLEKSAGGRIMQISIGGNTFTGRDVRSKLGLGSTHFELSQKDSEVELTVFGNGHGVGMSQWGAQGMALDGYSAEQILKHYYSGISIVTLQESSTIL